MSLYNVITPPIVADLEAIFDALPDTDFLDAIRGPKRRGRPGYDPAVLWRCCVARYALGVESVSAMLRVLRDNPYVAQACGINGPADMPSQPTLSRFGTRLSKLPNAVALRNVQRGMTRQLYATLPDFGKCVAIDSTDLKGWSNPQKRGRKKSTTRRQRPRIGEVSDPDCGWSVKKNTRGNRSFTFGFKAHILCDAIYEIPLVIDTTAGNVHDIRKATPLLQQARVVNSKFHPDYVLCDSGYSSNALRHAIKRQYLATPIIQPNPMHKKAVARQEDIENWREIYKQRTAIERVNGRLKGFFALDDVRVRGRQKVKIHAHMAVIALQARALAFPDRLRECVRPAAR
jgi:hypothetical protein